MIRLKPNRQAEFGFEWITGVGGQLNRASGQQLVAFVLCWALTLAAVCYLLLLGHPFWAMLVVMGSPHIEDAEDEAASRAATGEPE